MARFPSLPEAPHLGDVFKSFGRGVWPLTEFHDIVLRGESDWTMAERAMLDSDAQAVFAAGVSEQALYDAIAVCALFNFMNRIVEGCGVMTSEANLATSRSRHEATRESAQPYREFARGLGLAPADGNS